MITLLFGKDRYRLTLRRSLLLEQFRTDHPDGEVVLSDVSRDGLEGFRRVLGMAVPDLFGAPRLLDIREVFSLVDSGSQELLALMKESNLRSLHAVVSSSVSPKAKDPLLAFLKKESDAVEIFEPLSAEEAGAFFCEAAKKISPKVSFSRDAISHVVALFASDSARLSSLAEQLALYQEAGEVNMDTMRLFSHGNPKEKIFVALDALISGNRAKAAELLVEEARSESGGAIKIFGLLAWQLRELLKVRGEYDRGIRQSSDIAKACGMHPFVAGKLLSRIASFPMDRLKKNLSELASLDSDMKQGRVDQDLALAIFIEKF